MHFEEPKPSNQVSSSQSLVAYAADDNLCYVSGSVRNKAQWDMMFLEHKQRQREVLHSDVIYSYNDHPDIKSFPITACPEVFCSSYTTEVCQHLQILIE